MEEAGREGGGDGKGCGECLHLAQIVHDDVGEEFETPTTGQQGGQGLRRAIVLSSLIHNVEASHVTTTSSHAATDTNTIQGPA